MESVIIKSKYNIDPNIILTSLINIEIEKSYISEEKLANALSEIELNRISNSEENHERWYQKAARNLKILKNNSFIGQSFSDKVWIANFLENVGYPKEDIGISLLKMLKESFILYEDHFEVS